MVEGDKEAESEIIDIVWATLKSTRRQNKVLDNCKNLQGVWSPARGWGVVSDTKRKLMKLFTKKKNQDYKFESDVESK